MPISDPGSSAKRRVPARVAVKSLQRSLARGFTLMELLIVLAIVAISVGVMSLALRDGQAAKLEEEAVRLAALLEMARAEARASGAVVRWLPASDNPPGSEGAQFRFQGLPLTQKMPERWLDAGTRAEVVGAAAVVLGPEAILPAQRVELRLGQQRLDIASDGLSPFALAATARAAEVAPVPP